MIKQKEDVVYIADPSPEWRYWSPIKIGEALSLTIALQKDQAIALMLNKYQAQAGDKFKSGAPAQSKAVFGAVNGILGNQIKNNGDEVGRQAYQFDISEALAKTKMVDRSLITK